MIPKLRPNKTVRRHVSIPQGEFVISISHDGVSLRAAGKQKGVHLSYEQLAQAGLAHHVDPDPLKALSHLRRGRRKKTPTAL